MPRSSKHKSHRGHKRETRSDSEDEENSREQRPRAEEPAPRVAKDAERKSSGKDPADSDELGKKRKERVEEVVGPDRWNGGDGENRAAQKRPKGEESRPSDAEKSTRSKLSAADSKANSSRRHEASVEKNEESGSKAELVKQRSEKDSSRKESNGNHNKELKERDRERGSERDRKVLDNKHEKPADGAGRKERSKRDEEDRKKDEESSEWQIQDELRNPELEKELEKRMRKRRDGSGDKDKWLGDGKDNVDKRLLSRDERTKGGICIDERHKEGMYRDKYREDLDKDQRNRDDRASRDDRDQRHRDERVSRDDRDQRHRDERVSRDDRDQRHRDEHHSRDDRDQRHRDERASRDDRDQRQRDERDQKHRDERSSRDERDQRHREDYYYSRDERDQRHRDDHNSRDDRDQRLHDEKHRDEGSSRDRTSDRSDSKHFREEKKPSESRYKKSKYHDIDYDGGPYFEDHVTKYKDSRGRKRFSDVNEDQSDLKPRSAKEPREDVDRTTSSSRKFENHADKGRHSDKVDSSVNINQQRTSPSSSAQVNDQRRRSLKQAESAQRGSPSEERLRISASSTGDHTRTSGVRGRPSESQLLVKTKTRDDIRSSELLIGTADSSQYDRSSILDSDQMTEKSHSSSHRRLLDRTSVRHSLDNEVGQKSSFKDAVDCSIVDEPLERTIVDDRSQAEILNSEGVPLGSSSFKRTTSHFASNSPSRLPPPPGRFGIGSPSVLGSYEDDTRAQSGDRRSNGRHKRNGDLIIGRGQGNVWKGTPTWPSPVANGFMPLHGPPGFHPNVQQFPAPPLYGVRPSMDLNHTGVPYHVHGTAERFSVHGRPFGWQSPVDDSCPPHLQSWDGRNGMFGDESHVYTRADWDHNKHLMGSRGWEMKPEMWRGQDGNVNTELSASQKDSEYSALALAEESWGGRSDYRLRSERARSESSHAESSVVKRSNDMSPAKNAIEPPPRSLPEKRPEPIKTARVLEPSKTSVDDDARFCYTYLSKLDISLDLAYPDLYKQCMSLLEKGNATDICVVSKHEHSQENKEEIEVATNSLNCIRNYLFPRTSNALFQRAISLYKKQNEGTNSKTPALLVLGSKEESSPGSYEKAKAVNNDNNSRDVFEEGSIAAAMDVDDGLPDDSKEQNNVVVSDAVNDVVPVDGPHSQSFEAVIPECRVNLSRRPNSPESTH